jgi:hypothetical protein
LPIHSQFDTKKNIFSLESDDSFADYASAEQSFSALDSSAPNVDQAIDDDPLSAILCNMKIESAEKVVPNAQIV